jgi:hypothetical protein
MFRRWNCRLQIPPSPFDTYSLLLVTVRCRAPGRWEARFLAVHPRAAGIRPELVDYQCLSRSLARGKRNTVNGMRHAVAPFFTVIVVPVLTERYG